MIKKKKNDLKHSKDKSMNCVVQIYHLRILMTVFVTVTLCENTFRLHIGKILHR